MVQTRSTPAPLEGCFADAVPAAGDVARGVARLLFHQDAMSLCEVPLPNGRRTDLSAIDAQGQITIVEIKVSRADLLGDRKWPDYLDFCDRFYWAVPPGFDLALFEAEALGADRAGLIVADRFGAEVVRPAACHPLSAARRKAETLRFARRAARRLLGGIDPGLGGFD
jgi:hypothetical protein